MCHSSGRGDLGAVTAEYVVGTVAASTMALTVLYLAFTGWYDHVLWPIIRSALRPGVLLEQVESLWL